jgi:hypothetical protein
MKRILKHTAVALAAALASAGALADLTVGVSLPLTGPASGLACRCRTASSCGRRPSPARR